jgi:hypothetical protein
VLFFLLMLRIEMKDRNGKEVRIGDRVCLVARRSDKLGLTGKIGEVRDIRPNALGTKKEHARISDGPDDFSLLPAASESWCRMRKAYFRLAGIKFVSSEDRR